MNDDPNRKLLEFAGFKCYYAPTLEDYITWWQYPGEAMPYHLFAPDLTSLDAIFKWLVPEIPNLQGIQCYPTTDGWWWTIFTGTSTQRWDWDRFEGATLAEAFEQLRDKEE